MGQFVNARIIVETIVRSYVYILKDRIDYKETFSFVVKYDTVRFVLSISVVKDLEMIQLM